MSVKDLYELQCREQEISEYEKKLTDEQAAIGESQALKQAKTNLANAKARLLSIKAEQKTTEYAIEDISAKIAVANESLYSGRIKNPKELQNLQAEITSLQSQRTPLEDKDLSLMEEVEAAEKDAKKKTEVLSYTELSWRREQSILVSQIEVTKQALQRLCQARDIMLKTIPASELAGYSQQKKSRGWGIARVEQGTCGRCRLTLSSAELQRARAGHTVNCSSCGRLLFFE